MFAFLEGIKGKKVTSTSDFSRFFREASSGEKKKVFMDVARKASADQRKVIKSVQLQKL
jgi:hypothetical protein